MRKNIIIIAVIILISITPLFIFADIPSSYSIELFRGSEEDRIEALKRIGYSNNYWAVQRVVQILLTDISADMRLEACNILTDRVDADTIPALTYSINDENIFVRLCAVKTLRLFIDDYAVKTLIERLNIEDNDIDGANAEYYAVNYTSYYNVRSEIVKTLTEISFLMKKTSLIDYVITVLKNHYEQETDWGVKIEILESLVKLDRRGEGFDMLKKSLEEETDLYIIEYAEEKLWDIGMGAFADKILEKRNLRKRHKKYEDDLSKLSHEELIEYIILNKYSIFKEAIEAEHGLYVVEQRGESEWRIGTEEMIDKLSKDGKFEKNIVKLSHKDMVSYLFKNRNKYISDLKYSTKYTKRLIAINRLSLIANGEIVDYIEEALKDDNRSVRRTAVTALGRCGDEFSVNKLLQALENPINSYFYNDIELSLKRLGYE